MLSQRRRKKQVLLTDSEFISRQMLKDVYWLDFMSFHFLFNQPLFVLVEVFQSVMKIMMMMTTTMMMIITMMMWWRWRSGRRKTGCERGAKEAGVSEHRLSLQLQSLQVERRKHRHELLHPHMFRHRTSTTSLVGRRPRLPTLCRRCQLYEPRRLLWWV